MVKVGVFLDISKAFDKVWYEDPLFEFNQNEIFYSEYLKVCETISEQCLQLP